MEALEPWGLHSKADIHREALLDLEDYFAVKGLLSGSDKVSYKQHNNIISEAVKELDDHYHFLPGLADQHILQSKCVSKYCVEQGPARFMRLVPFSPTLPVHAESMRDQCHTRQDRPLGSEQGPDAAAGLQECQPQGQ